MTTPTLMPLPKQQFLTALGTPLVAGSIFTYAAGTNNPKQTFSDAAGTVAQPNPIPLNARGEPANPIFWNGAYKVEVHDALGNVVYTVDNFNTDPAGLMVLLGNGGAQKIGYQPAVPGTVPRQVGDALFDLVSAKTFGALGDGVADDTAKIQAALDYAAANGRGVYVPAGAYRVSKLRIKNGCRSFWTDSATLIGNIHVHEGVIELDGTFFATPAVQDCKIYGFTIDGGGVARRGIFAATAVACSIFNNHIFNLDPAAPDSTICLHFNSSHNRVYSNKLEMPATVPIPDCVGVYVISQTVDQYSGWMAGAIATPTNIAAYNDIFGNYIYGGSHGISLFGSRFCNVYGNTIQGQRDRSIIMAPAAINNVISGNNCLDFGSTGVHMAYGSNGNTVIGNSCIALGSNGEAGIQAYVACTGNKINSNLVQCASKYGIYLAIDASYNDVSRNTISGNPQKAGIAIESDWSGALPGGAIYSRPNYGPPAPPRVNWPNGATFGNTIQGNVMNDLPAGVAAISVAQIGNVATNQDNVILQNVVNGATPQHYLHIFETTAGQSFGHVVEGNKFKTNLPAKIMMTRGRGHLRSCLANSILNEPGFIDIATTATPDVSINEWISTAGWGAATTITNFINGMEGQRIRVRMSVSTTIQNNANIKTKGGVDAAGGNANDYMTFENMRGIWVETSRTF